MFGHGCLPVEPDFGGVPDLWLGAGLEGVVGAVVDGVVVDGVVVAALVLVVLVPLGAAAAPAMPAAAPAVASAPATIVAPSMLDTFMASNLLLVDR